VVIEVRRAGDAARKIHQETEHHFAYRGDEPGARLRHQHARLAGGGDIDVADIDGAAQEGDETRQAFEDLGRTGGLPVRHDQVAVGGGGDQGFAFE
jgi:hypothetical protein